MKLVIFLLYNNLFIYQVLCTLIHRRRSIYPFLLCMGCNLENPLDSIYIDVSHPLTALHNAPFVLMTAILHVHFDISEITGLCMVSNSGATVRAQPLG